MALPLIPLLLGGGAIAALALASKKASANAAPAGDTPVAGGFEAVASPAAHWGVGNVVNANYAVHYKSGKIVRGNVHMQVSDVSGGANVTATVVATDAPPDAIQDFPQPGAMGVLPTNSVFAVLA